jgi:hypothetical protein
MEISQDLVEELVRRIGELEREVERLKAIENAGGGIDLTATEGAVIYGNATSAWAVLAHPGSAYEHLETTASGLGWQVNLTLADNGWVGLGAAAGRVTFDGTGSPDEVVVETADFLARSNNVAFGPSISVNANIGVYAARSFTDYDLDTVYGVYAKATGAPTASFQSNVRGVQGIAELSTAQTQTGAALPYAGVHGAAGIANGIAGTLLNAAGGHFTVDAEDGTLTSAYGVLVESPDVDTGTVTSGYGVKIEEGTAGGSATFTTQYGLYVESMDNAGTNYAIYTNDGEVRFGGVINATVASIRLEVDTSGVTDSGPTDAELDSAFGTPATVGAGFEANVDDGGAHARYFKVGTDGTNWYWMKWNLAG